MKKYGHKKIGQGWWGESRPHGLCSKGIKLGRHKTDYAGFGISKPKTSLASRTGYTFAEAIKITERRTAYPNKTNLKVVYGTKTGKFHFIMPEDRDFNTPFAVDLYNFQRFGSSKEAKRGLSGIMIHNKPAVCGRPDYAIVDPNIVNNSQYLANAPLRDSDKDGVPDVYDWDKDNNGVPNWEESDGLFDPLAGSEGSFNFFHSSAKDSDQDGVPDHLDLHPFDPNKTTEWAKSHKKKRR